MAPLCVPFRRSCERLEASDGPHAAVRGKILAVTSANEVKATRRCRALSLGGSKRACMAPEELAVPALAYWTGSRGERRADAALTSRVGAPSAPSSSSPAAHMASSDSETPSSASKLFKGIVFYVHGPHAGHTRGMIARKLKDAGGTIADSIGDVNLTHMICSPQLWCVHSSRGSPRGHAAR